MISEMNELLRLRVEALDNELQETRVKLVDKDRELNRAIYKLNTLKDERALFKWN